MSYKTIAELFSDLTMARSEAYLTYVRPTADELERFGRLVNSSNWGPDGEPIPCGYSFSPSEVWEFSDGSRLEITCSTVRVQ
jgi:hypothetical protein